MKKLLAIALFLTARVLIRAANWCSTTAGNLLNPKAITPARACPDCGLPFVTREEFAAHQQEKHSA